MMMVWMTVDIVDTIRNIENVPSVMFDEWRQNGSDYGQGENRQ